MVSASIYCLNGSRTGHVYNFKVDLRDGTSLETMARAVLSVVANKGYTVWADNAFTSVAMCQWCRDNGINFAGTTRITYGFPSILIEESMTHGQWTWAMSGDGIFAAFWCNVGMVKLMSNFHNSESSVSSCQGSSGPCPT